MNTMQRNAFRNPSSNSVEGPLLNVAEVAPGVFAGLSLNK